MKLFAAVLLSTLPVMASSVTYDIRSGALGVTFTSPDYLPLLDPSQLSWKLSASESSFFNCGQITGLVTCDGTYLERVNYENDAYFIMRAATDSTIYTAIESTFYGADLLHTGSWVGSDRVATLKISAIDAPPTLAPEPSSWMLLALGIGLIGVKSSRRLLHRAIDSVEVVRLRS